jgi:hypothetical protein
MIGVAGRMSGAETTGHVKAAPALVPRGAGAVSFWSGTSGKESAFANGPMGFGHAST